MKDLNKKGKYFFLLCPHSKAIMVKGWILDLPIIPQPIVFLCIVLAAQPTLSWSLSDLDQWAHFSQYRGLCQQRLHILIVMHCKHQKSKKDILPQNQNMEALKLLNEPGDPDILLCIANIMSQWWKDILRQTEIYGGIQTIEWPQNQGGTCKVDTALAFWSIPMTCNCHDEECKRTRPPFYHETPLQRTLWSMTNWPWPLS